MNAWLCYRYNNESNQPQVVKEVVNCIRERPTLPIFFFSLTQNGEAKNDEEIRCREEADISEGS